MKNLKKFFGTFMMVFACAMLAVSCGTPTIEEVVKETSKKCPVDTGNGMVLESVTYEGGEACYEYTVKDANVFASVQAQGEEGCAKTFLGSLKASDGVVRASIKENKNVNYALVDEASGEAVVFVLTVSDLKTLK